jgi:hypothetical protein
VATVMVLDESAEQERRQLVTRLQELREETLHL